MKNEIPLYLITCFHPERFFGLKDQKELSDFPRINRDRMYIEDTKRSLFAEGERINVGYYHGSDPIIDTGTVIDGNRFTKIDTKKLSKVINEFDVRLIYTKETPGRSQQKWKLEFRNHFGDNNDALTPEIRGKLIKGMLNNPYISIRQLWKNPITRIQFNPYAETSFTHAANLIIGPMESRCKVLSRNDFKMKDRFWHITYEH